MNEHQEKALALLRGLTPATITKRPQRETTLLALGGPAPEGYGPLPDQGLFAGWAFRMGTWFCSSLDIVLQRKLRDKTPYHAWTQGSLFHFRVGYTMPRLDGGLLLQVSEARPAIPAFFSIDAWPTPPPDIGERVKEAEWDGLEAKFFEDPKAKPEKRWKLRTAVRRSPGFARLRVYEPNAGPTIWKERGSLDMSQDDLVRMLISGEGGHG